MIKKCFFIDSTSSYLWVSSQISQQIRQKLCTDRTGWIFWLPNLRRTDAGKQRPTLYYPWPTHFNPRVDDGRTSCTRSPEAIIQKQQHKNSCVYHAPFDTRTFFISFCFARADIEAFVCEVQFPCNMVLLCDAPGKWREGLRHAGWITTLGLHGHVTFKLIF